MLHDSLTDSLDIEVEDIRCENIAEKDVGLAEAQIHETNLDNLTAISSRPLKNDHNELHHKTIHGTFDDPSLDCGTNHDGQYSQMRLDIRRENDWIEDSRIILPKIHFPPSKTSLSTFLKILLQLAAHFLTCIC
ncbi:hypothetical protein OIU84_023452 [Salix udensis]|uniref:Uncharacterized protein n=1 Tax=Salix udensis TaxID=889485 RepID=A0AAD6PGY9_9ROSI|nr:hypothetical protein OIU84_023452 [Salix udensis]